MKRSIFTICCFLLLSGTLSAQVDTFTASNLNLASLIGTSKISRVKNISAAPSFAPQANGSWDLTSLYYDSTRYINRFISPIPGYTFADTLSFNFWNTGNFNSYAAHLAVIQSLGTYEIAIDSESITHKKPSGKSDTITFSNQTFFYSHNERNLLLPLYYHEGWHDNFTYSIQFNVTDSSAHVHKTQGRLYSKVSESDSVVGYGKMRVNRTDTNTAVTPHTLIKSGYDTVLQVRKAKTQIDSYALLAPSHIYDSLGFHSLTYIDTAISGIDTMTVYDSMTHTYVLDTTTHTDSVYHLDTIRHITENISITVNPPDTVITYDTTYTYSSHYSYFSTYYFYTYSTHVTYYNKDTTNLYEDYFYRRGTITPFVHIVYTNSGYGTPKLIEVNTDNLSQFNEGVQTTAGVDYNINVYPNPVAGNSQMYIDIATAGTGTWSYDLYNMAGQLVSTANITNNNGKVHQQISVPSVAAGIYLLRLNNNGTQTFVKPIQIAK